MAVITARLLGAAGNGLLSVSFALAALVASFGALGLDTAVVRSVAIHRAHADRARVLGALHIGVVAPTLISIALAAGVFLLSDVIATNFFGEPAAAATLRVAAVLIPALVLSNQLAAALQGWKRLSLAAIATQFLQPTARFALLIGFALVGLTAVGAIMAATVGVLIGCAVMLVALARLVGRPFRGAVREPGPMIRFAVPVFFSDVVATFGTNIQLFLLTAAGSLAAVGVFAVADQLNLLSALFHTSIVAAVMPHFAQMHDGGDAQQLQQLYRTTSLWTFALDLPVFAIVVLVPAELLSVFGPEFVAGATALAILACASLVNVATGTSGALLDMTGHTNVKFLNATISVVLLVVLGVLLIPAFGAVGAALAFLVATASVNLIRVVEVALLVGVTPYDRSFLNPLRALVVAFAAAVPVMWLTAQLPAIVRAIAVALVVLAAYGTTLLAGLRPDERETLRAITARLMRRPAPTREVAGGR
jgi:O-antigen/teichoic acid export membrane protein